MEITVELFDKICRVCLEQSTELKSLFTKLDGEERNLLEILSFTANIDVKSVDTLPKQVCGSCESIMCKADAFKRRCLQSETILNNVSQKATATTNVALKCTVKDEKIDLKEKLIAFGTLLSPTLKKSSNIEDIDSKIEINLPACSKKDLNNKVSVSNTLDNYKQSVKEEVKDFDDDDNFLDHFDDGGQLDIIVPAKNTEKKTKEIKTEGKIAMRYECYCRTQFTDNEKYKAHLKLKQCDAIKNFGLDITDLQCAKCSKQFSSIKGYKIHQRTHHNENSSADDTTETFQCSFCLRKFKNKVSLATHVQRHEVTDNIKHTCEICKREFRYKAYLENHILTTHSRTNQFTCEVCAQTFSSKETLDTHKKDHENEKKHRCTVCNKGFYMLCTLKEHMRTHTGEKPFLCSQCGKGFSQKTNLAQHMRRHQGLKPFKCENCEKRFVSKGELEAHNRKHSGAHPFVCDECGNGFTTSSALVKHRRVHTGERPYHCDLCPMKFAASGTLKNHRRTHTGERPFQCSYCEKAFVQRNDLISHIRCHTGERPYICTQCGQSFRKASGLKTHVKMHIKDPVVGVNAILTGMHCTEQ